MNTSPAALVFGLGFVLAGVAGFFPSPPPLDAPALTMPQGHGMALGFLPVNIIHNVIHLLFGVLGLAAARGMIMSATGYFQIVGVTYILLAVLGLIPATQTTFGLVPIWGNDVYLHAFLGVGALYFGFMSSGARSASAR